MSGIGGKRSLCLRNILESCKKTHLEDKGGDGTMT